MKKSSIDVVLKEHLQLNEKTITELEKKAEELSLPFHQALVEAQLVTPEEIINLSSKHLRYETLDLKSFEPNLAEFPISLEMLQKHLAVPVTLTREDEVIHIATCNPQDLKAMDAIAYQTGLRVIPYFTPYNQIKRILDENSKELEELVGALGGEFDVENQLEEVDTGEDGVDEPYVVKLVNKLLFEAVEQEASDIHIEPMEFGVRVRFRIDGRLHARITNIPSRLLQTIMSRIKVLARLDISENRRPQDGSFRLKMKDSNKIVDFRVSTMITQYGEKAVLRLQPRDNRVINLETIGLNEEHIKTMRELQETPYGLILVTGPTGSGKTNTLYAMLSELNDESLNIVTIEDPIERSLPGVSQTQINPKAGITFESALKTTLRQDPDIIMLGEIRTQETADTAIEGALTGHLVMATLHTNDALSALTRLEDIGVDRYKLPSSLIGVIAQRLVRKICKECATTRLATEEEIDILKQYSPREAENIIHGEFHVSEGKGCRECNNTGYKGRTPVFELLEMKEELKNLIIENSNTKELYDYAKRVKHKTLQDDAVRKVINKETTVSEIRDVVFLIK